MRACSRCSLGHLLLRPGEEVPGTQAQSTGGADSGFLLPETTVPLPWSVQLHRHSLTLSVSLSLAVSAENVNNCDRQVCPKRHVPPRQTQRNLVSVTGYFLRRPAIILICHCKSLSRKSLSQCFLSTNARVTWRTRFKTASRRQSNSMTAHRCQLK